jgi:hypothetical protein
MTHDSKPRFSIIIPAKDRAEFLSHTLRSCSLQAYENLEVIVSDDGSSDHTRDVVEEAAKADSRIRYMQPPIGGMRENFEFALRQVKPGYVVALGADDGLLPHGITGMLETLRETGQQMLAWPAPVYSYAGARGPRSQLLLYRKRGVRIVRSAEFLRRQTEHLHYLSDLESPMFYVKGVVSTELVDRVKSRSADGRFYVCSTPDGYSGIVLAGETDTYAYSGKPFSIYGLSPASQGMNYLADGEKAKKQSESFFRDVAQLPMHQELASQPYSPLIALMTADYLYTARDLPGWPGQFPPIDFRALIEKCLNELAHGLYSESRLGRELNIVCTIAESKGLGEYFKSCLARSRRFAPKEHFSGNGASPSATYFDGQQFGLRNIVDAAYFAYLAHEAAPHVSLGTAWAALKNSLRFRLLSMKRAGPMPAESTWRAPAPTVAGE